VNRKSTRQSGIQRGGGCCEAAISAGDEWAGEPVTERREASRLTRRRHRYQGAGCRYATRATALAE